MQLLSIRVTNILYVLIIVFFFSTCGEKGKVIEISTASKVDLMNYLVRVEREQLEKNPQKFPLLKDNTGKVIPTQFEDEDLDGQWDYMIFQTNLISQEKTSIDISWIDSVSYPEFQSKTQVYLGESKLRDNNFVSVKRATRPTDHVAQSKPYLYQYEGPGWESELVAFRSYFDSRNGKDIFGKTGPIINAHQIGLKGNYHELQDWGMDILKVGTSLGAGALAMLKNDSLYRLGVTNNAVFEVLSNGPVKSTLRLTYEGWEVAGKSYDLIETISIWGSKRWYQSEIELVGGTETDTLVTGIVDLKNAYKKEYTKNDWYILFTHGEQSENKDHLGMALLVPNTNYHSFSQAPDQGDGVINTYVAYLKNIGGTYKFIMYAGWAGENKYFEKRDFFNEQLSSTIAQMNQEIKIEIK